MKVLASAVLVAAGLFCGESVDAANCATGFCAISSSVRTVSVPPRFDRRAGRILGRRQVQAARNSFVSSSCVPVQQVVSHVAPVQVFQHIPVQQVVSQQVLVPKVSYRTETITQQVQVPTIEYQIQNIQSVVNSTSCCR